MTEGLRRAIIDIGSNSVRLVIFGGAARAPVVLYNEKLMAGLGRGVIAEGRLSDEAQAQAISGLARFREIVDSMGVVSLDAVATAAVRDAENGGEFLAKAAHAGVPARLLSGEDEAVASGFGVISAIPDADGVVADLGGGSLELVRVYDGAVHDRVSLPLGILTVPKIRAGGIGRLRKHVQTLIAGIPWAWRCNGLPLYLVGGSWRSLARVHMERAGFPLSVIGSYDFPPEDARPLADEIASMDKNRIKLVPGMPSARVPMVEDASALLAALVAAISPSHLVTCAFGLREGLLFQALSREERALDPLLEGVGFATMSQQQVPGYGRALMRWLDGLFGTEPEEMARLRHAVCMMRGTGWASNPDFRALGGEELALHGNWIGVTASDRAIMGMALFVGMGGKAEPPSILSRLAEPDALGLARKWGTAIRLAQRLSGGAPAILDRTTLARKGSSLTLSLPHGLAALQDSTLRRRLDVLATSLGLADAQICLTG